MDKKRFSIKWCTQILVIALLTLGSCGPAQNKNQQVEKTSVVQKSEIDSVAVEKETPLMQEPATDNEPIVLNPPHGEPGHRCEIPVGSPLNGPAAAAASNTSAPPAATEAAKSYNSMAPTVENAQRLKSTQRNQTSAPATGEKPKLNPPHGQPWHRCDITVGSPLP